MITCTVLEALDTKAPLVYNVGIGKGNSVREFVDACRNVTGVDIKVKTAPRREGDAPVIYADPRKVRDPWHSCSVHR